MANQNLQALNFIEENHKKLTQGQAICLKLKIIPKSGKRAIGELMADQSLKIKLKSVAQNNKANKELIEFLSEIFSIPGKKIMILSGEKSRNKVVKISP